MDLLALIDAPFRFKSRPVAVPGDYRPAWRISLVVLILACSRSNKASLQKLHVISWAMRTRESRAQFLKFADGAIDKQGVQIRIDPTMNLAFDFAVAEGLAAFSKGKNLQLTAKGRSLADEIESAEDCMVEEKAFLASAAPVATEKKIATIFDMTSR